MPPPLDAVDAPTMLKPTTPITGVLERQLQQLVSRSNHFSTHAQASLRFLERRRRRLAAGPPCAKAPVPGPVQAAPLAAPLAPPVPPADTEAPAAAPEHAAVSVQRQHLKEVLSDPVMSRSRRSRHLEDSEGRMGTSSLPSLLSLNLDEAWPSKIFELLRPECVHAAPVAIVGDPAERKTSGMRLHCGSHQIPHPRKADTGGEDSFFTCSSGTGAGVADGVGEWEWRFGVNPRAFADELMDGAMAAAKCLGALAAPERAVCALEKGYESSASFGSATALVAVLDAHGCELGVANLGDSGLRQIRWPLAADKGCMAKVVARTKDQQHSFNCPYQLARLPKPEDFEKLRAAGKHALVRAVQSSPSSRQDVPRDAGVYSFPVKEGDLIVLGTDGVFDNLHDDEVCELVGRAVSPFEASREGKGASCTDPRRVAEAIARAAFHRSEDTSARTPFSLNAREHGLCHLGGKMDDITVVCAWVV